MSDLRHTSKDGDLWEIISDADPLPSITYVFTCDDGPDTSWHVRRVELIEELSAPYELTLHLLTSDVELELGPLLGANCEFVIDRETHQRSIYGVVETVEYLGRVASRLMVRVRVVPSFALMKVGQDSRAWQEKTAPEILEEVLATGLKQEDRVANLDGLTRSDYPRRDYCVQSRESDFAFASRLMEEEGITYYFEHDEESEREILMLVDQNSAFPALSSGKGEGLDIPLIASKFDTAKTESVQSLGWSCRLRVSSVTRRDFDWQRPATSFMYDEERASALQPRPVYTHGDRLYADDGAHLAARTLERLNVEGAVGRGEANVIEFSTGRFFRLLEHGAVEGEYILTRVVHRGDSPEETILMATTKPKAGEAAPRYTNTFECVPRETVFRPARRHLRPRVYGPQTAIVTGPQGEEVHTDEHGRIKVRMYWDRLSRQDERSSWWVRVAHTWAGAGWGSIVIPRIGMEVVVEFLEGNPDRPLVIGCVYNGANRPPYELPAEKTKSTLKSNSSLGGGGYNELRFEDRKGSEEIFVHAQKDMNVRILNNRTRSVGNDESITIGNDESITIGHNRSLSTANEETYTVGANRAKSISVNETVSVGSDRTSTIGRNETLTIGASRKTTIAASESTTVGASRSLNVGGSEATSVGGSRSVAVAVAMTETVGAAKTETVGAAKTETVGAAKALSVGAAYQISVGGVMSNTVGVNKIETVGQAVKIDAGTEIELTCGASSLKLSKDGKISIDGTMIEMNATGRVVVRGATIHLN